MKTLVEVALKFVGIPYIWGGSCPAQGFDCSGLIQEILSTVGMDPPGDQSAQTLYDIFSKKESGVSGQLGAGALVFYGKDLRSINHVSFMIDEFRVIEAAGGNSSCLSVQKSIDAEAFVKVRTLNRRKDIVSVLMPKYPGWLVRER